MDKRMSLDAVVAELRDGMTIGIGGWGPRRKPMELVRAICRSPLRDLTVVSYGGPDVGLLCSAGKVRRVVFGFVSLDRIAVDPHFRRARSGGAITVTELDEGMLQWGLYAAALRLPFLPTRAGLGSDVEKFNPELRRVASPYGDDEVIAMPALELDAALVHVNRADARGTGQILGVDHYFDDLYCMAAKRAYVSCEVVVPTEELLDQGCVHSLRINRMYVHGVIEAPRGAWFTSCAPDYAIDDAALDEYVAAASPEKWPAYRDRQLAAATPAGLEQ
jgi:glutaconate CoA-transferase subunit A